MPGTDQNTSRALENEALRAKVAELKARLATLQGRVTALEQKKQQGDSAAESTCGRS